MTAGFGPGQADLLPPLAGVLPQGSRVDLLLRAIQKEFVVDRLDLPPVPALGPGAGLLHLLLEVALPLRRRTHAQDAVIIDVQILPAIRALTVHVNVAAGHGPENHVVDARAPAKDLSELAPDVGPLAPNLRFQEPVQGPPAMVELAVEESHLNAIIVEQAIVEEIGIIPHLLQAHAPVAATLPVETSLVELPLIMLPTLHEGASQILGGQNVSLV